MKTIIARSFGINWMHYALIRIDGNNADLLKTWRAHKFEDRGRHSKTRISFDLYWRPLAISEWRRLGKPGGMDGLKANFRKPPSVAITKKGVRTLYRLRKAGPETNGLTFSPDGL